MNKETKIDDNDGWTSKNYDSGKNKFSFLKLPWKLVDSESGSDIKSVYQLIYIHESAYFTLFLPF